KAYSYLPQDFLSSLDLIAQSNIEKTGSLGYYNFTVQEALDFHAMSGGLINYIVTGSEQFPAFTVKIRRAKALKLGDEIYQSFFSRSDLNSNIFARWQLNDGKRINWLGVIKFFFEHRIFLPNSTTPTSHFLAIVDWYKRDLQKQSYFYVKSHDDILSTNADGSYHTKL
ncbi:6538_t:CDS:2, partial [Racocetra persica]